MKDQKCHLLKNEPIFAMSGCNITIHLKTIITKHDFQYCPTLTYKLIKFSVTLQIIPQDKLTKQYPQLKQRILIYPK